MRWKDKGLRDRHLLTVNGDIRLARRYWWRSANERAFPSDGMLGVDDHGLSPPAREACCRFSLMGCFADSMEELRRYANIPISKEFMRQVVEREGERIAAAREEGLIGGGERARGASGKGGGANAHRVPQRLYASLDGVFARMVKQEEKQARRDKAEKNRAGMSADRLAALAALPPMRPGHTDAFREMKVGLFYSQDRSLKHTFVTCEDHEEAGRLLAIHARSVSFDRATERLGIVDGAVWIEAQMREKLPGLSLLLLDFFHLSQHVHEAARQCLGENDEAQDWARARLAEFRTGGPQVPLAQMRTLAERMKGRACAKAMQGLIGYVEKRIPMLDYPQALRRGSDIGSGPMEAQCKTHIRRVKLAGAKWDRGNAQSMMNIVALRISGGWDGYWHLRQAA